MQVYYSQCDSCSRWPIQYINSLEKKTIDNMIDYTTRYMELDLLVNLGRHNKEGRERRVDDRILQCNC